MNKRKEYSRKAGLLLMKEAEQQMSIGEYDVAAVLLRLASHTEARNGAVLQNLYDYYLDAENPIAHFFGCTYYRLRWAIYKLTHIGKETSPHV